MARALGWLLAVEEELCLGTMEAHGTASDKATGAEQDNFVGSFGGA